VGILIIILFVAIIALLAIASYYQQQQRRNDLLALAARHGWQFDPAHDWAMEARYPLACLEQGSDRYAYNVFQGRYRNRPICAFDYHYETYSTDSKGNTSTHHHTFSMAVLETGLPLKPLLIRSEHFGDTISEFFGADDIDFESHEFSREFFVKSPDRRWAFDVIHQATMEFLLAAPRFTVELAGPRVFVYRDSEFDPPQFEQALEVASGIIDRLPQYLLNEWKGAVR
jgi:hypothetical protein